MSMYQTVAFAKKSSDAPFEKIVIERNEPGDDDVQLDIVYCGICHSDVHIAELPVGHPFAKFPCVPGHEIAGIATKVGKNVKDIKTGDRVGVGCLVDCCETCESCLQGDENYCLKRSTWTYNGNTEHGRIKTNTGYTFGGYSANITANRKFIFKIPAGFPMEKAGPIFCSGITTYSPLKHWKADQGGKRVGIVGIGGLGQMGIRLAKSMGNHVVAISTSPNKRATALEIGADEFLVSKDAASMAAAAKSFDLILNTVSAHHDIMIYLSLLKRDGTVVQLGGVAEPMSFHQMVFFSRINLSGSGIGNMVDTQECIDYCAKNDILPATQIVKADQLAEVYEKLNKGNDQVIRYVLDLKNSL